MTHNATAPHELEGNLVYVRNGLDPYWFLGTLVTQDFDGGTEVETSLEGEPFYGEDWTLSLGYQKGGVAPRETDPIDSPRLYEYRITCRGRDQRKAAFLIQPRFDEMRHYESGDRINTPFDDGLERRDGEVATEGVNVRIDGGSNLEPEEYPELLRRALEKLAEEAGRHLDRRYFADRPHPASNITAYERYVRVRREQAKKVIGPGGPFSRLQDLLATQKGMQAEFKIDNEDVVGYNHRVWLGPREARELVDTHQFGKQLKHYHPREVQEDEDDPLYHPKIGVLVNQSRHGTSVPWGERETLSHEMEETLVNLLLWADVPIEGGSPTFVADDHFRAVESDRDVGLYDDPTPEIEASQEAAIVNTFRQLTDADHDLLEFLADEGGEVHPEVLADGGRVGLSTVYRFLERAGELVTNDNAAVSIVSEKVRQDVQEIVARTEQQVDAAARALADVVGMNQRILEQKGAAFEEWCAEYAVDVDQNDGQLVVKVGTLLSRFRATSLPHVVDVLEEGLVAWSKAGGDRRRLEEARVIVNGGDITGKLRTVQRRFECR